MVMWFMRIVLKKWFINSSFIVIFWINWVLFLLHISSHDVGYWLKFCFWISSHNMNSLCCVSWWRRSLLILSILFLAITDDQSLAKMLLCTLPEPFFSFFSGHWIGYILPDVGWILPFIYLSISSLLIFELDTAFDSKHLFAYRFTANIYVWSDE